MTLGPRFMQLKSAERPFQGQTLRLRKTLFQPRQKQAPQYRRQRPEMSTLAIYSRDKDGRSPNSAPMVFIVSLGNLGDYNP